jgi:hypothetical protein
MLSVAVIDMPTPFKIHYDIVTPKLESPQWSRPSMLIVCLRLSRASCRARLILRGFTTLKILWHIC